VTYLLDVNFLIALCDNHHAHYRAANGWFAARGTHAWATCPMTENGFVRITAHPSYPYSVGSAALQIRTLRTLCTLPGHVFWPDDLSITQPGWWVAQPPVKSAHVTDLYLVLLAAQRGGKLVSFDRRIPAQLIKGGSEVVDILTA
jgi:toxin-antitoxin system PIN domain toxin